MSSVFSQMIILITFALAGYILSKLGKVDASHAKILSVLEIFVFLPCTVIKTFSRNFTVKYFKNNYDLIIVGAIILISVICVSLLIALLLCKKSYERNVYIYSLIVPNTGYIGYALAEALYGSKTLQDVMIFGISMNIFINTVGFCLLTKKKITLRNLCNPVVISMLIGAVIGITNLKLPDTALKILDSGSGCMAPVSMIIAGIVVSEFNLIKLLVNYKNYIVIALRLLIIPAAIAIVLNLIGAKEYVLYAILIYALPCGMNGVVFPKLVDENSETGAALAFISTLLSCLSIPLMINIFL